jgi:hypothetical protein
MFPALTLEVDAVTTDFHIAEIELRNFLADGVGADLVKRAIRVEAAAKRIASNRSPSAPGQGPGVVTGRLRASITWRIGRDYLSPYVDIGSAVEYAPFLELGTGRMAARPFLRPALFGAARTE